MPNGAAYTLLARLKLSIFFPNETDFIIKCPKRKSKTHMLWGNRSNFNFLSADLKVTVRLYSSTFVSLSTSPISATMITSHEPLLTSIFQQFKSSSKFPASSKPQKWHLIQPLQRTNAEAVSVKLTNYSFPASNINKGERL